MSRPKLKAFLVIDDEEANEFISRTFIQRANCAEKIISVTNGKEGLDFLVGQDKPEIILLDINMPSMNAWQFLEEAQRIIRDGKFPFIVILSSSINPQDRMEAEAHTRVNMFMSKPLNPDKVNEILEQYFEEYHED